MVPWKSPSPSQWKLPNEIKSTCCLCTHKGTHGEGVGLRNGSPSPDTGRAAFRLSLIGSRPSPCHWGDDSPCLLPYNIHTLAGQDWLRKAAEAEFPSSRAVGLQLAKAGGDRGHWWSLFQSVPQFPHLENAVDGVNSPTASIFLKTNQLTLLQGYLQRRYFWQGTQMSLVPRSFPWEESRCRAKTEKICQRVWQKPCSMRHIVAFLRAS